MRYILNDSGFIETISFDYQVECNNKSCTEYTGSVPTGYESLAEWSELANINAYKIVNGNLTYDSNEDTRLQNLWASQQANTGSITLNMVYPVGSIYMSINNANPSILFGGTWEQISGRFLIGVGSCTDDNNETWEFVNGQAYGEYNHRLTVEEMPVHSHWTKENAPGLYAGWGTKSDNGWITSAVNQDNGGTWETNTTGGDQTHNNMPPYLAVYMWKRIS